MKKLLTRMTAVAAAVMTVLAAGGCVLFVAGAAAGAGTIAYYGNELRVSRAVGIDRAWAAANAGMIWSHYCPV
jgi:hypothetical protein